MDRKQLTEKQLYKAKIQWFQAHENFYSLQEFSPAEFYRAIFPKGSFEEKGDFSGKPNGIIIEVKDGKGKQRIVTDDLEEILSKQGMENIIMSPIGYYGRRRTTRNSSLLFALVFDLDGQEIRHLEDTLHQMNQGILPKATFVVLSGHGLHLYYVFDKPIPMKPYVRRELEKMKAELTKLIWNRYVTKEYEKPQYQPITQGFRIVGSASKMGKRYPVRAWQMGARVTVKYLNGFLMDKSKSAQIEIEDVTPIEQAKELWPDWYQRRVVEGKKKGRWYVKRALYDWWLKKISTGASVGHRYFCIMTLAVYARKCDVPFEELKRDAYSLLDDYDRLSYQVDNPFTEKDIIAALKAYKEDSCTYPRETIERISGIQMLANKRNYRTRKEHIKIMNFVRDEINQNRTWNKIGNGRPKGSGTKKEIIKTWREQNPDGKKIDCHRATRIDPKTIRKWWE